MEPVAVDPCKGYEIEELFRLFDSQFQKLGVYEELKPGMTALLKPNLIMRSKPEAAAITHPAVTAAVGLCVQKAGAKVLIAESGGGPYTPGIAKGTFSACGYTEIADRYGFSLYTACESREVSLEHALRCRRLSVIKPFLEADYLVDIAKLKTHGMLGFSWAVINLFGAVPGLEKPELHCRFPEKEDFADMLLDLCDFLKPRLSILDGVWAMEGDGPTGGRPRFVGAVLASKSPWALDVVGAALVGMTGEELVMLRRAAERGLGPKGLEELTVLGTSPEQLRVPDFRRARAASTDFLDRVPGLLRPVAQRLARPSPKVQKNGCVGCGKCEESCPMHSITLEKGKAKIDYRHCIRCFCCQEMCPQHVIEVRRLGLFRF